MREFILGEPIPLRLFFTKNEVPVTGATVTVDVYDETDLGTPLLGSQTCSESGQVPGYYVYDWDSGITERKKLMARYMADSKEIVEHILVGKDLVAEIDWQDADGDGRAF